MLFCLVAICAWIIWGALYAVYRMAHALVPFIPVVLFVCAFILYLGQRSMLA